MTVPLVLTGKAIGATNGGNLHQSLHVRARGGEAGGDPDQAGGRRDARWTLATRSTSATSSWASGVRVAARRAAKRIASVVAPKAEKVEEAAAAPVEGAVPAEGAAARRRRGGRGRGAGGAAAAAPARQAAKKEKKKK